MKRLLILLAACLSIPMLGSASEKDYWHLNDRNGITWVNDGRAHDDHIEMSGKQVSVVLRYGIGINGSFHCNYGMVWPMLRTIPNNTHASLMRHLDWNVLDAITTYNRSLSGEHVDSIVLNGLMTVYSHFGDLALVRTILPSTSLPAVVEQLTFTNNSRRPMRINVDDEALSITTNVKDGVTGSYVISQTIQSPGQAVVRQGEKYTVSAVIYGRRQGETLPAVDVSKEIEQRQQLISQLQDQLVLETPDPILNRMFAFSKIRACESIYETKAGPMHGPGGESYYAAVWANDQAEYANPYFPFTGYDYAIQSAMVSWKLFEKWQPKDWKPIPSSIIAEGDDIWNGAGDRGDAAMIAYGAGRFALETGSAETARKLWPLIRWCLEYCHRQLNDSGVVRSDHDELEGRFPAGTANLNTSCLYYDALISAAYLAKDLRLGGEKTYLQQAKALRKAIDNYFHAEVQGFDTYKYYADNTLLRSWISVPLAMGIYDHAEGTLNALFSPKLWTENGLLTQQGDNTYWDRSTLYALRGAFAAGETQRALDYLEKYSHTRLLGNHVPYAIEAWPEGDQRHLSAESALYGRIFTEGVFGIRPTGLHSFTVTPRLPEGWNEMSLKNVHLCGKVLDLDVARKGGKIVVSVTSEGKTRTKNFERKPLSF